MNLIRWIWFGSAEVRRLNRAWATETLQRALHRDSEFFFVPRSWQDEKHLSLFLCRAQNLQSLLFYLQAIIWFVKSFAFSSQRRPVFEGSSTRRLNDQAWRLHISLLQVTKIDGKYEQAGESIKKNAQLQAPRECYLQWINFYRRLRSIFLGILLVFVSIVGKFIYLVEIIFPDKMKYYSWVVMLWFNFFSPIYDS